jgi:hypothetical protein
LPGRPSSTAAGLTTNSDIPANVGRLVPRNRSLSAVLGSPAPRPRPEPFSSRNRSNLRRRLVVGALVLLSLILITISFRGPSSGVAHGIETAGATVLRPFEVAAERIARPFRDVYGYFAGLVHVKRENERLKEEVTRLRQQALLGGSAQEQLARLRALLQFIDSPVFPKDYERVSTRVISLSSRPARIAASATRRRSSPVEAWSAASRALPGVRLSSRS